MVNGPSWLIEYTIHAQRVLWYMQRGYTLRDMLRDQCNKDLDPVMLAEVWRDLCK